MAIINTYTHPFELPLEHTALLIIDMQNDFCHPDGFNSSQLSLSLESVRAIIPSIQVLLDWSRKMGLTVVFTRESHSPDLSDLTSSKQKRYTNAGSPIGEPGKMGRFLVQGEKGVEIIDELKPLPHEIQLDKPAHSCFVNTQLDHKLRSQNITHLLITGVTTQCCVLATYRHASDLGYDCLLLDDCCAAFDRADHDATIHILQSEGGVLGWVAQSSMLYHV
ncbi:MULTISPECIES: isochorismatase family cysteine hydrolase [Cyanophyceae]|uniref:cysteine hydrolase family protein n=1 Tax=Cyanophyceae TaxID=3028117 RepID=UPI00168351A0|nr:MULTISPECIES: isochorismatase family cysteine hydrolase [Cyanophyceae]MBD1915375.1 cysteine hydrolase [Phormidium sp. FACHB-77]MBD2028940.1 cysteine hydrolase [Phormidium sp. FACHB-322]MBD2049387.1 cysteine hydrolase [Leptolyngbya sp. FACHB-60]